MVLGNTARHKSRINSKEGGIKSKLAGLEGIAIHAFRERHHQPLGHLSLSIVNYTTSPHYISYTLYELALDIVSFKYIVNSNFGLVKVSCVPRHHPIRWNKASQIRGCYC